MPDRRGRKGDIEVPQDRGWAQQQWNERDEVKRLPGGHWLLREAAKQIGVSDKVVSDFLSQNDGGS